MTEFTIEFGSWMAIGFRGIIYHRAFRSFYNGVFIRALRHGGKRTESYMERDSF